MERMKLTSYWGLMYYALFVLLLFSNFTTGRAVEFDDDISFDSEPSQTRSSSQHRSSKGRNPNIPGGPGSTSSMAPTVWGWVFCTSCLSVNTPLLGVEAELLCPHPPTEGGGQGSRETMVPVSATVTGKDGSFHLTANVPYSRILNRCAVMISNSSDANCDLPPPTGTSLPVSDSSISSSDSDGPHVLHHFSLRSFSFRPVSCLLNNTKPAAAMRKPRTLLQHGDDPLGAKQGFEKNHNEKSTIKPTSGSDLHGGEEQPAVVVAHHHQMEPRSRSHRKKRMNQAPTATPPHTDKFPRKATHGHRVSSFVKSLMMMISSHPHPNPPTVDTNGRRHHRGGGPPHTISTNSHHHYHGGPPHSSDSDESDTNNTVKP